MRIMAVTRDRTEHGSVYRVYTNHARPRASIATIKCAPGDEKAVCEQVAEIESKLPPSPKTKALRLLMAGA